MRIPAILAIVAAVVGCSKEEAKPEAPEASAAPPPSAAPAPTPSASAAPSAAPSASAEEAEPHHDCPAKSTGIGSFTKPCEAKGGVRLMKVLWKKTDDKGPSFSIKNVGTQTILYGKIAVYFYDKAGKQLDVSDDSETPPKTRPFHTCGGNIFQGVMKPNESAVITFSCVPKKVIPDGTATIEGEMQMVGFADSSEKKNDFYWRNVDLTPNARSKGGVK
ncbi:MAG TPA: hypothetical protein VKU41_30555 [Polyangiaceae bacterium]|nr:hypothetical protein [Polyangiaceae bacterium]